MNDMKMSDMTLYVAIMFMLVLIPDERSCYNATAGGSPIRRLFCGVPIEAWHK
jgi:hypothetical protein